MSIIPEVILHKAIIQGFRQIRKDSRLIDVIFKNTHQTQLAQIKDFLLGTSIDFSINYPKKDFRVPALCLILKSEDEAQTFLGDVLGASGSDPFTPDPELSIDTLGGHATSISTSRGLPRKIAGPLAVSHQEGTSTIYFQEDQLEIVQQITEEAIGCLKLYVVGGAGQGYSYNILRIRNDSLDIAVPFEVYLDNTSLVDLRVPNDPELSVGEPSRVYNTQAALVRKGVNYEVTYHLHILAEHQDQVIYLYTLVKALLLAQRVFLESQGIQVLKISGSDFVTRAEMLPDESFSRQMTLTFTYPFSFLEDEEAFSSIAIDILPEPADDPFTAVISGVPIDLNNV